MISSYLLKDIQDLVKKDRNVRYAHMAHDWAPLAHVCELRFLSGAL